MKISVRDHNGGHILHDMPTVVRKFRDENEWHFYDAEGKIVLVLTVGSFQYFEDDESYNDDRPCLVVIQPSGETRDTFFAEGVTFNVTETDDAWRFYDNDGLAAVVPKDSGATWLLHGDVAVKHSYE